MSEPMPSPTNNICAKAMAHCMQTLDGQAIFVLLVRRTGMRGMPQHTISCLGVLRQESHACSSDKHHGHDMQRSLQESLDSEKSLEQAALVGSAAACTMLKSQVLAAVPEASSSADGHYGPADPERPHQCTTAAAEVMLVSLVSSQMHRVPQAAVCTEARHAACHLTTSATWQCRFQASGIAELSLTACIMHTSARGVRTDKICCSCRVTPSSCPAAAGAESQQPQPQLSRTSAIAGAPCCRTGT